MKQATDLPVISNALPAPLASRRRFPGWRFLGLFASVLAILYSIYWYQGRKASILRGIEERGGLVYREPTPLQELVSDFISFGKPKPRGKSGVLVTLWIHSPTSGEIGLLRTSPSVKRLILKNGRVTKYLLEAFRGLPNLTDLMLMDFNLTNEELKQIVEALPHPEDLKYLGLKNTKLDDAGLASLTRCKSLASIYIDGSNIDGSGLSSLSELPLTTISINHSRVKDGNVQDVVGPWRGSLKLINLNDNSITDEGLKSLQGLKLTEMPGISGTEVTVSGLKELLAGRQVRMVMLGDLPWSISDLNQLPLDPKMTYLGLSGWKIGDEDLKSLPEMPNLAYLELSRTLVTDDGLEELKRFPALVQIRLDQTKVTPASLEKLKGFPKLVNIGLGGSGISFEDLRQHSDLGAIKSITLDGMGLTDEQLRELRRKHPGCSFYADDRYFGE